MGIQEDFEKQILHQYDIIRGVVKDDPWKYTPVTFEEFVASKDHMRFPYLSPRQLEAAYALLNRDPKKIFDVSEKKNDVLVALWGQASGKDLLASFIVSYIAHVLLCLKNPYEFLTGFNVPDEPTDIVNVAYSYAQASNVFFTKLKGRIKNWSWLRDNFRVRESGKDLDPARNKKDFLNDASSDTVTIYPAAIMFPNMIRSFSRHSITESTEGLNPIAFILDEASAMKDKTEKANADKLYTMLSFSAQSRFPNKWFGFILSWPRHKNDFTMRMYKDVIEGRLPRAFASKGATWEIRTDVKYEDFKEKLENPKTMRDAKCRYAVDPPSQEEGFIEFPDKITECVDPNKKQAVEFEKVYKKFPTGAMLVGKSIKGYNMPRQPDNKRFVAHVDLGHMHDLCALAVGHLEGPTVVIDLVTHWQAEPNCPIDVDDPADVLIHLKKTLCSIGYVTYDQWNSISSLNRLNRAGIVSEKMSLKYDDYTLLRSTIYSRNIVMPDYPLLTDTSVGELANLKLFEGNKVDHGPDSRNDITECVCGVVSMLLGTKQNVVDVKNPTEFYANNEGETKNSIWTEPANLYNSMGANEESAGDEFISGMGGLRAKLR